jgi:antitoxin (DNA-binding transcriptional repressor) of toxin-antitoxin stability system
MKTIPAGQFKTHCLSILDDVMEKREVVLVTKHGKSVAQVTPCPKTKGVSPNPLKNSVVFEKDIVDSVDLEWEADS